MKRRMLTRIGASGRQPTYDHCRLFRPTGFVQRIVSGIRFSPTYVSAFYSRNGFRGYVSYKTLLSPASLERIVPIKSTVQGDSEYTGTTAHRSRKKKCKHNLCRIWLCLRVSGYYLLQRFTISFFLFLRGYTSIL